MMSNTGIRRRKPTPAAYEGENGNTSVDDGGSSAACSAKGMKSSGHLMVHPRDLDASFREAMRAAAAVYGAMCVASFALVPPESHRLQESDGASVSLGAASLVMAVSVCTRGLSLFFAEPSPRGGPSVIGSHFSGAALVGFFVQACSALTNGTMAIYRTPVLVDPVTGMDVYLLRWCEWAPLAFLMAFLTASMDAEKRSGGLRGALNFGLCQGISTLCGVLFPVLKPRLLWWTVMTISCVLHATLYPLLLSKSRRARSIAGEMAYSAIEMERHERIRVAAQLVRLVTVAWATLILFYFLAWFLRVSPTTNALMECSVDVMSKHLYLNFLLDAHHRIFDPSKKAERSLAEIGHMMNQVSERRYSFTFSSDDYSSSDDSSHDESTSEISPSLDVAKDSEAAKPRAQQQQQGKAHKANEVVTNVRQHRIDQFDEPKSVPGVVKMPMAS